MYDLWGEHLLWGKLTKSKCDQIRRLHAEGFNVMKLANNFHLRYEQVWRLIRNEDAEFWEINRKLALD